VHFQSNGRNYFLHHFHMFVLISDWLHYWFLLSHVCSYIWLVELLVYAITCLFLSLIGWITGSCYHMFVLIFDWLNCWFLLSNICSYLWLVELLVPAITCLFFALIGWISDSCNFVGSKFLDWITGSCYYSLPYSDNVSLNLQNSRYSKFLVRSIWKQNVIGIIFSITYFKTKCIATLVVNYRWIIYSLLLS